MKKDGVTLIALIITVIILLILAGTAISISINGGNIFEKATEAKENWDTRVKTEEVTISDYLTYVDDLTIPAWDGTVGTSFASGTGTESDPYIIENGEQLAYFASTVNTGNHYTGKYVSITQSINLGNIEFTPIGIERNSHSFDGTLEGNGNIITGIKITQDRNQITGLINCIGQNGIVQNLMIGHGEMIGANNIGGIAGLNHGKVINCSNKATISSLSYQAGGIVGVNESGGKVINCYNSGKITANLGNAGGIVGGSSYEATNASNEITGCFNSGEITTCLQAGGICGGMSNTSISKCTNTGKIYASDQVSGGIIGYFISGTVIDCENRDSTVSGRKIVGGIVGQLINGTVSGCTNDGEVNSIENVAGGIVGFVTSSVDGEKTISNCKNTGKISAGTQSAGGIVGVQYAGITRECTNKGEICSKGEGTARSLAGGIVAAIRGEDTKITKVYNSGSVTVVNNPNSEKNSVGGIIGSIVAGEITIAYNEGTLTGGNYIGGIVGENKGTNSVTNSCFYYKPEGSTLEGVGTGNDLTVPNSTTTRYESLKDFLNSI